MENGLVLLLMLTFQETFERKIWEGGRNMKPTEEKTYLRIVVKSFFESGNIRHSYVFEQWEGEFLNRDFKFKRVQYSTNNRYEAKLMMGILGLNNIRRYHLSRYFGDILNDCFIEFED